MPHPHDQNVGPDSHRPNSQSRSSRTIIKGNYEAGQEVASEHLDMNERAIPTLEAIYKQSNHRLIQKAARSASVANGRADAMEHDEARLKQIYASAKAQRPLGSMDQVDAKAESSQRILAGMERRLERQAVDDEDLAQTVAKYARLQSKRRESSSPNLQLSNQQSSDQSRPNRQSPNNRPAFQQGSPSSAGRGGR
ncbi:hypothetical protein AB0F46_42675 [Streptomyces sp. NPDC026665]|uniref:hypothetical protein n=1 Tax=Streptomyces sp. NPDC026665 TaxID=3154798 RepID=UPI0033FD550A